MAALLFIAGDTRDMLPHSRVMIHDPLIGGAGVGGSALSVKARADDLMRIRDITAQVIAEHTGHAARARVRAHCPRHVFRSRRSRCRAFGRPRDSRTVEATRHCGRNAHRSNGRNARGACPKSTTRHGAAEREPGNTFLPRTLRQRLRWPRFPHSSWANTPVAFLIRQQPLRRIL